ncbi:MAG: hypothetical protein K0Q72_74 [Armatimonadetes bacterium]|nr:hypothetical protein [Armatimonadota bacterium]
MLSRPETGSPACARVQGLLPALHEGALSAAEATEAEAHLSQCAACAREAALALEIGALLRRDPLPLSQASLPSGDQIARSIIEAEQSERGRAWRLPWGVSPGVIDWSAGLIVVAALVLALFPRPHNPASSPSQPAVSPPAVTSGFWIEDDERTGRDVIVAPAAGPEREKS